MWYQRWRGASCFTVEFGIGDTLDDLPGPDAKRLRFYELLADGDEAELRQRNTKFVQYNQDVAISQRFGVMPELWVHFDEVHSLREGVRWIESRLDAMLERHAARCID